MTPAHWISFQQKPWSVCTHTSGRPPSLAQISLLAVLVSVTVAVEDLQPELDRAVADAGGALAAKVLAEV